MALAAWRVVAPMVRQGPAHMADRAMELADMAAAAAASAGAWCCGVCWHSTATLPVIANKISSPLLAADVPAMGYIAVPCTLRSLCVAGVLVRW